MRSRFEELHNKSETFVGKSLDITAKRTSWWNETIEGVLDTYDKLTPTKEYLVQDPLSKITRIAKRNLLVFSSILLLITTYQIGPQDVSLVGISLPKDKAYVYIGGFGLIVIYQLISFLLHYMRDIGTLFQTKAGLAHEFLVYPLFLIHMHLRKIEEAKHCVETKEIPSKENTNHAELSGYIQRIMSDTKEYSEFIEGVSKNYLKLKALTSINYVRLFTEIFLWDFMVVIALSLISIKIAWGPITLLLADLLAAVSTIVH